MGWVKTEAWNVQYGEVLSQYPSKAGVRSAGANDTWIAKCGRRSAAERGIGQDEKPDWVKNRMKQSVS